MATHKKYYNDGELKSLIETKTINYDRIKIDIIYKAEYSNDGFIEFSTESEKYYTDKNIVCKSVETKHETEKDSQKITVYFKDGLIQSRTFLECTPFLFTEEFTSYNEDGSLSERKTTTIKTDPIDLEQKEYSKIRLRPIGNIKEKSERRNIYKNGHLLIRYALEHTLKEKKIETYTEYNKNNEVVFIEKKEKKRNIITDNQIVENVIIENTFGLKDEKVFYEEIKENKIERLCLDTEEIENINYGENTMYLTLKKHKNIRRYYEETSCWEKDIKHKEVREKIYKPDGTIMILRKKYKKLYFDETGIVDMISSKEVEENKDVIKETHVVKEFGQFIGEYSEQKTELLFKGNELKSCKIETYYDPEHIMGYIETTKGIPENYNQFSTVRQYVFFGILEEGFDNQIPFWNKFIEPKGKIEFDKAAPKDFLEDVVKSMKHFLKEEKHEWVIYHEMEIMKESLLESMMETQPLENIDNEKNNYLD